MTSKITEELALRQIINSYDLMKRASPWVGERDHVCLDYRRPAPGRLGWTETNRTTVWSLRHLPGLSRHTRYGAIGFERDFFGLRDKSLPQARAWVKENFGYDVVRNPTRSGGYCSLALRAWALAQLKTPPPSA